MKRQLHRLVMKSSIHQKAFTLIEILVVTTIIIFLSALVLTSYQTNSQQLSLSRSAYKLSQDIRRAGEMAMSAKEFQGQVPPGYGIYLKQGNTYYLLYADTNGNEKYDGADGNVETIYLEEGVYIKDISPSSLSINFKPPNPTIKIKTESGNESSLATVTIALISDTTKTKKIKVNIAGLTEVD